MDRTHARILAIDDDDDFLAILFDALIKYCGTPPLLASSGKVGMRYAKYAQPDIVIIDIKLLDMSGIHVINQIKEDSPKSVILAVTALPSHHANYIEAKEIADLFIQKPLTLSRLRGIIDAVEEKING